MRTSSEWTFDVVTDVPGRHVATVAGRKATWRDLVHGLRSSDECRTALTATLASCPEPQVFWETPPLTTASMDATFEFVVTPAALDRAADPSPFSVFLADESGPVVTFANLGGDATLVVPSRQDAGADYSYLLSFLRTAGSDQIHAFWAAAGAAIASRVDDRPVWISTSGGGVSWLHLRLDDRPKYYVHQPYRTACTS